MRKALVQAGNAMPHGALSRGGFSPIEVAKAWRDEHPTMFDDIEDADLIAAIREEDPDTYALVDPLLEGAEILAPSRKPVAAPPPWHPTPPMPQLDTFGQVVTTGMRVVPPLVAGGVTALATKNPYLTAAVSSAASGFGATTAQWYEKTFGPREAYSPGAIAFDTALGAVNPAARGSTTLARTASQMGYGGVLGGVGGAGNQLIETGELPSWQQTAANTAMGAAFGGAVHAGFEGVGALARRAPDFGDSAGALPQFPTAADNLAGAPPPPPPSSTDAAIVAQASRQVYEAEESRLATLLTDLHGTTGLAAKPSGDLHVAMQSKAYLEELARLHAIADAAPPPPLQLEPGQFGDPNLIDYTGPTPPPAPPLDRLGGQLEQALGAPPGPPRLIQDTGLHLSSPPVPRGIAEAPPLLERPIRPATGPIQQGVRVGGRPATPTQPRLKGVLEPGQDRPYATGPNAGPRRPGERHAQPRPLRRQVRTGKQIRYETVPSTLHAEDPSTYPPEVRRELARMVWELDALPHTVEPGGLARTQIAEVMERDNVDVSTAIATLKREGASSGGALSGAPVYHEVIAAAQGSFSHVTRGKMLAHIRTALLEGKGNGLTDAAAQVARGRIAQEARGGRTALGEKAGRFINREKPSGDPGRFRTVGHAISSAQDAGDALIGWVDHTGMQALPEQDLDEFQRAARDATDGEVYSAIKTVRAVGLEGLDPVSHPFYTAALNEGVKRGLIEPEQLSLVMEGPGGEKGPSLFDFEGGPPKPPESLHTRNAQAKAEAAAEPPAFRQPEWVEAGRALEQQVRGAEPARQPTLPGTEGVRDQDIPTPAVADVPFSLTSPPTAAESRASLAAQRKGGLFTQLMGEEGVILPPPLVGDREGLKKWLAKNEKEHGGSAWFSRVEEHLQNGEPDKAWKAAASASIRSYNTAFDTAKTPQEQAAIARQVRGTALQSDLNTQIITAARQRAGVGDAPPVREFPPSIRATQAGAARGKATIGPAGITNPGPRQRPLSTAAPALRAATLDLSVVRLIKEGIETPEGLSTIPGNTDTWIRLYRQIGEGIYKGQNLKLLRDAGVRIPPEELAQHWNATISDAGRTLQLMSSFAQAHKEILTEAAGRMDIGAALGGAPPTYTGARGRVASPAGQRATQEVIDQIAERTSQYQAAAMANDLQKRSAVGPLKALHDASYSFMLSKWNTAVRNYVSFTGRYTVDSLDHALTIPFARLSGDAPTAVLSSALLKERGLQPMGRTGTGVTPKAAWSDDLQGIYNFTADNLSALKPNDARRAIRLLLDQPEQAAHFMGAITGEDLQAQFSTTPVLRHLVNPKVQRVLTMFNRAQEFSARATVFDATTRALLRAKGLDPTDLLQRSTPEIIQAVGGQQAFDDLLFTSTAQALEATFAGRTSKDSIPGALIRFINEAWPLKLGMPFPRFNLSAAPRWLFDHSPAALLDVIRFPFDRAGITAPKGSVAGGRLYRGVRAQEIVRDELPALQLRIGQAEKAQGTALQELLGTQREYAIRSRQIARLQKRVGQPAFSAELDTLAEARTLQDQLGRRRERLKSQIQEQKTVVGDLKSEQKQLLNRVTDATGINAPNYAQFLARMTTGTVGMLGAAWVVRSQDGAEGTRWYEYRVDREGKDPIVLDFRPFAPFAQYLFVADVLNDFSKHTNWSTVKADTLTEEEGVLASPLDWSRAIWNNYEGKYTEAELGSQFAQAFLSISRAAGTTLTLTDLLTQNGWPSLEDASRAIVGTLGQFLSRFTVPGQQISDVVGQVNPEEAKVRTPPKATVEDWERPLAAPFANVPGVRQLIPESISQTTGRPVAAEYPLLRALAGIGTSPRDFVTEEVRRIGVPGQSVFIRETGDYGLDRMIAESYSAILKEELPGILEDPSYTELSTPARQRDYMQRYIFPALKRAALGEARTLLGEERFTGATVRGEEARRRTRQERLLTDLEEAEPVVEQEDPGAPPGPPTTTGAPPPPPF